MTINIYSVPKTSLQFFIDSSISLKESVFSKMYDVASFILMNEEMPENLDSSKEYIAQSDGVWLLKKIVPSSLSRAQAETVMDLMPATTPDELNKNKTLLDEINEYMDTLDITVPMYKYIKNVWKNSIEFNRDDDVITTIAAIFKISDDQLDEMFITGAQFSTTLGS